MYYDETLSTSIQLIGGGNASTSASGVAIPNTSTGCLASIDNDGFTVNKLASTEVAAYGTTFHYIAGKI